MYTLDKIGNTLGKTIYGVMIMVIQTRRRLLC